MSRVTPALGQTPLVSPNKGNTMKRLMTIAALAASSLLALSACGSDDALEQDLMA